MTRKAWVSERDGERKLKASAARSNERLNVVAVRRISGDIGFEGIPAVLLCLGGGLLDGGSGFPGVFEEDEAAIERGAGGNTMLPDLPVEVFESVGENGAEVEINARGGGAETLDELSKVLLGA